MPRFEDIMERSVPVSVSMVDAEAESRSRWRVMSGNMRWSVFPTFDCSEPSEIFPWRFEMAWIKRLASYRCCHATKATTSGAMSPIASHLNFLRC